MRNMSWKETKKAKMCKVMEADAEKVDPDKIMAKPVAKSEPHIPNIAPCFKCKESRM
jgi:hypothetical protein